MARQVIRGRTLRDRLRASPTRELFRGEGAELSRSRDYQRAKVYAAESRALWDRTDREELTFEGVVELVRSLEESAWWQTAARTEAQAVAARDWAVTVVPGSRRDRRATARPELWEIRVPPRMRARWIVVHELAHLIAPDSGHGPGWVEVYLEGLVAAGLEEEAVLLAESMRAGGVRGAKAPEHYRKLEVPDYPEDGRLFPLELVG